MDVASSELLVVLAIVAMPIVMLAVLAAVLHTGSEPCSVCDKRSHKSETMCPHCEAELVRT